MSALLIIFRKNICLRFQKFKQKKNKKVDKRGNLQETAGTKNDKHPSIQPAINPLPHPPLKIFETGKQFSSPTPTYECGFYQAGDVYYERSTNHQAGRMSRDACDFMRSRSHDDVITRASHASSDRDLPVIHSKVEANIETDEKNKIMRKKVSVKQVSKTRHLSEVLDNHGKLQLPSAARSVIDMSSLQKEKRKTFVVMYSLTSSTADQLNLLANDVIYYLDEEESGWLKGQKKESGEIGWFPKTYVREGVTQAADTSMFEINEIKSDSSHEVDDEFDDDDDFFLFQCIAKHNYEVTQEDDLALKVGDVIFVKETLENGWWKGENGDGKSGFFPGSYAEVQENVQPAGNSYIDLSTSAIELNAESKKQKRKSNRIDYRKLRNQIFQKFSIFHTEPSGKNESKVRKHLDSMKALSRKSAPRPENASLPSSSSKISISTPVIMTTSNLNLDQLTSRSPNDIKEKSRQLHQKFHSTINIATFSSSVETTSLRDDQSQFNESEDLYANLEEIVSHSSGTHKYEICSKNLNAETHSNLEINKSRSVSNLEELVKNQPMTVGKLSPSPKTKPQLPQKPVRVNAGEIPQSKNISNPKTSAEFSATLPKNNKYELHRPTVDVPTVPHLSTSKAPVKPKKPERKIPAKEASKPHKNSESDSLNLERELKYRLGAMSNVIY